MIKGVGKKNDSAPVSKTDGLGRFDVKAKVM